MWSIGTWGLGDWDNSCLSGGMEGLLAPGEVMSIVSSLPPKLTECWPLLTSSDTCWRKHQVSTLGIEPDFCHSQGIAAALT